MLIGEIGNSFEQFEYLSLVLNKNVKEYDKKVSFWSHCIYKGLNIKARKILEEELKTMNGLFDKYIHNISRKFYFK